MEDMVARMKGLGGKLKALVGNPGANGNDELIRVQEQLRRTRRQLDERDQELAELRARPGENQLDPEPAALATALPHRADGQDGSAPFYILGPPKCGTSWLQATLNSHPEIFCSGEGKFFGRNLKTDHPYGSWGPEVSRAMTGLGDENHDRPSLYSALADSKDLKRWFRLNGGWTRKEDVDLHTKALVRLSMDYVFAEASSRSGKPIVGDKTPSAIHYLEEIHEFYPEARIIHIIRDGRDHAVSSVFHCWRAAKDRGGFFPLSHEGRLRRDAYYEDPESFGPGKRSIFDEASLKALAGNWRNVVAHAREAGPRLFADRYFEVKYEELLRCPEPLFAGMLRLLGADADERLVEKVVQENSFEKRSGNRAAGVEDPKSFFRKGIAGDWKNHLTERDRRVFRRVAGDLLVDLGYEKDDHW